ncbi:toll/interleukin-1 receptor domain-containing protein [Flavobacteriaceae bacterium S0862]|nr:toll/interleukin-1 receptor domain-containing protein [Flavobacteriaceae bacterium S0862]
MYNAFISYSHGADGKLAQDLQSALEKFAKPWYKLRNLSLFRDESSLSASPNLWSNITHALDQSEYLIYMASPDSASSKWVSLEIEYWLKHKSIDTLLIVLTDGDILWDDKKGAFKNFDSNSLPEILVKSFNTEPFYVDLRNCNSSKDLTLNNPIFKKEVLKIAAQLHGKEPKDMASQEIRNHKKTIRIRNGVFIALSSLLIVVTYLSFYAFQKKNLAEEETLKLKASNFLANAQSLYYTDKTESLNMAFKGYRFADSLNFDKKDLTSLLLKILHNQNPLRLLNINSDNTEQQPNDSMEIRQVNGNILSLETDGSLDRIILTKMNRERIEIQTDNSIDSKFTSITFSPKGKLIIVNLSSVSPDNENYLGEDFIIKTVYNLEGKVVNSSDASINNSYLGGDHDAVIVYDENEQLVLSINGTNFEGRRAIITDVDTGKKETISYKNEHVTSIALDHEGCFMAYGTDEGKIRFLQLNKSEVKNIEWIVNGRGDEPITSLAFSENSEYLISKSSYSEYKWPVITSPRGILAPILEDFEVSVNIQNIEDGKLKQFGAFYIDETPFRFEYISETNEVFRFDTIYNFTTKKIESSNKSFDNAFQLKSPNAQFVFKKNGIFNEKNELLIPIDIDFELDSHRAYSHASFSNDSKFLLIVDSSMFVDDEKHVRVYMLDPKSIINRLLLQTNRFKNILNSKTNN